MRTVHVEPGAREGVALALEEIDRLLAAGKCVTISVAQEGEWLSPHQVADRLGVTRQQVEWLIRTGELEANLLGDGHCWQVAFDSLLDLEARRESSLRRIDALSGVVTELRAAG